MPFFENVGRQTEMLIFLKLLLKFGMEIDLNKSNKYLQFEPQLFSYDFNTV